MAEVNLILFESPQEGASVALVYNDQTLQATHFLVTVPASASNQLVITWALNGVQQAPITATRGSSSSSVPLGTTLQGVVTHPARGGTGIDFGITQIGFSFSGPGTAAVKG